MKTVTAAARRSITVVALGVVSLTFAAPRLSGTTFMRGDIANNGVVEFSDVARLLEHFFLGEPAALECLDAADTNDDGQLDLADTVFLLSHVLFGTEPPPVPFPECAEDPTTDGLDCVKYVACGPEAE